VHSSPCPWAAASCDETAFDDPDELILDPPNVGLATAFGRAIHHCVGAPLARLEARVVVTKWLGRTPNVALDPNSNRAGPTVCDAAQQVRSDSARAGRTSDLTVPARREKPAAERVSQLRGLNACR
jgi:cytochrome P450